MPANKLNAAITEPGGPLFNGRTASASELIKFNRQWRGLLSLRKPKPALFTSVLQLMGLMYINGKIKAGEPWELFADDPGDDDNDDNLPGFDLKRLNAAITEPGGPLFDGRTASAGELIKFNRQWRKLLSLRRTDPQAANRAFTKLGVAGQSLGNMQKISTTFFSRQKPEETEAEHAVNLMALIKGEK